MEISQVIMQISRGIDEFGTHKHTHTDKLIDGISAAQRKLDKIAKQNSPRDRHTRITWNFQHNSIYAAFHRGLRTKQIRTQHTHRYTNTHTMITHTQSAISHNFPPLQHACIYIYVYNNQQSKETSMAFPSIHKQDSKGGAITSGHRRYAALSKISVWPPPATRFLFLPHGHATMRAFERRLAPARPDTLAAPTPPSSGRKPRQRCGANQTPLVGRHFHY